MDEGTRNKKNGIGKGAEKVCIEFTKAARAYLTLAASDHLRNAQSAGRPAFYPVIRNFKVQKTKKCVICLPAALQMQI